VSVEKPEGGNLLEDLRIFEGIILKKS